MKYALVGYGRMGVEIEAVAGRRGHTLVAIVDPGSRGALARRRIDRRALGGVEVAFEFTKPDAAESNVAELLAAGVAVVCGTTGWDSSGTRIARALRSSRAGLLVAPNFSIGVQVFFRLVEQAARAFGQLGLHDPYIVEAHHRAKADAPSGTARKLAALLAAADPRFARGTAPGELGVTSIRAGHEPGTHTVGFDGEHDAVTLTHRARSRAGFALGAVLAAEWLRGRTGRHGFEDVVSDLLAGGGATPPVRAKKRKGGRR